MKRFATWGAATAVAAILVVGALAPAALAGGSTGSGVSTMRPFSDPSWTPAIHSGVVTMQPFDDEGWNPGTSGVLTMRPFSDPSWAPAGKGVFTVRPFSDPNAIGHVRAVTATASLPADHSGGSRLGLTVGLIAGLLVLGAAAGYASRQRRARPA